jgi:hypothetical protein
MTTSGRSFGNPGKTFETSLAEAPHRRSSTVANRVR